MKKYRVAVFEEQGGYMTVEANSPEEAEEKAEESLNNDGISPKVDVTHRECYLTGDVEEVTE